MTGDDGIAAVAEVHIGPILVDYQRYGGHIRGSISVQIKSRTGACGQGAGVHADRIITDIKTTEQIVTGGVGEGGGFAGVIEATAVRVDIHPHADQWRFPAVLCTVAIEIEPHEIADGPGLVFEILVHRIHTYCQRQ